MSEGDPENGDISENPEPEADAEFPEINRDVTTDHEREITDQPEDDLENESPVLEGKNDPDGQAVLNCESVNCTDACPQGKEDELEAEAIQATQQVENDVLSDAKHQNETDYIVNDANSNREQECSLNNTTFPAESASPFDKCSEAVTSCETNNIPQVRESNNEHSVAEPISSLQDLSAAPEDEARGVVRAFDGSVPKEVSGDAQAPECDQDISTEGCAIGNSETEGDQVDQEQMVEPKFETEKQESLGNSNTRRCQDNLPEQRDASPAESFSESTSQIGADYISGGERSVSPSIESENSSVDNTGPSRIATNSVEASASNQSIPCNLDSDKMVSQESLLSEGPQKGAIALGDMDSNSEDDLLSELDAELHIHSPESESQCAKVCDSTKPKIPKRDELVASESAKTDIESLMNGLKSVPDSAIVKGIQSQFCHMEQQLSESETKLNRLCVEKSEQAEQLEAVVQERDGYLQQLHSLRSRNPDDLYIPQIKELEYTIAQQQNEIRSLREKLTSHDNAAKRAVSTLQNELKNRIDQVTKMYEDCLKEKDAMVVKFAESEQKNIEAKKAQEKMETKLKDSAKEKENLVTKIKTLKTEKHKVVAEMDTKTSEVSLLLKEIEKLKDQLSSSDVRIKWAQNKLRAELEAHKDTKLALEKNTFKLKEAREETQQIRRDCQAMIKTYQESEEIKSNSLDKELKLKETELIVQKQVRSDREEFHQMTLKELESLKIQHKDTLTELKTLKDKVKCLEEERLTNEETMAKYKEIIQKQKSENKDLLEKTSELAQVQEDFHRAQGMIKTLDKDVADLMITNKDLQLDMEGCRCRESEILNLTEKLSKKNATLQSENTNLNNQVVILSSEVVKWKMEVQELDTRSKNLADQLLEEQRLRKEETESLQTELTEKTKEVDNMKQQLEDEKDLTRTVKRKHVNNIKDLTRQLQQARRKLESYENHTEKHDNASMGSRTSSNGSLNIMERENQSLHTSSSNHNSNTSSRATSQEQEYPVITEQVEVDKQVLIERIVRLQKAHARKNEKLEFLDDHIHQLVDEIQKKNRIIQHYVMREEAGTLAPEYMDEHKPRVRSEVQALLAKKGGIMASVYSSHQQDGTMTLELSLEITKKLQGVLEDTLLKNITLKESLDTLGTEISRLSQENRKLQLQIQDLNEN